MLRRLCFIMIFAFCYGLVTAQPAFKGGQNALDNFITSNIVYPEYSRQNCIAATIKVGFRINAEGKVDSAFIQDGPGIDLDDEALRIVKMTSGKWQIPTGYITNSVITIPIAFTPDYARCANVTGLNREAAINNYKAQEQLQDVITKYYKDKYAGKADVNLEPQIVGLKKQLGYGDQFISDLLEQADRKYKQGDKEGACKDWNFVRNIGSDKADAVIAKYCK